MKTDSTSGVCILSRKIRVNILLILILSLPGWPIHQSFANDAELLMSPKMVSAIPMDKRVIVDTRPSWKFLLSHVPGAINLSNWQEFTSTQNGIKGLLRNDKDFISKKLSPLGFSPEKTIIVYGDPKDPWRTDGRFFWMFEHYGFNKVAILNGGLTSWKNAGKKVQRGRQNPKPATGFTSNNIQLNNKVIADKYMINSSFLSSGFSIIDNRTRREFDGDTPYGSPRGGHIPNAIHIHWPDFFQNDGSLKELKDLNILLQKNDIKPDQEIIVYCTGGVRSAMAYFVFRYMGYKVRNYDGSWWDWSQSSFPVEAGS